MQNGIFQMIGNYSGWILSWPPHAAMTAIIHLNGQTNTENHVQKYGLRNFLWNARQWFLE